MSIRKRKSEPTSTDNKKTPDWDRRLRLDLSYVAEGRVGIYSEDPMVNAVLNVAAAIHALSRSTDSLIYGLKYSRAEGMSIAEAIEVAAQKAGEAIGSAIDGAAQTLRAANEP